MRIIPLPPSSAEPRLLAALSILQRAALALVAVVAVSILFAWVFPSIGRHLPAGWDLMKANTAVMLLLCTLSLFWTQAYNVRHGVWSGRLLGLAVAAIALVTALEFAGIKLLPLDTILAPDESSFVPGRPSLQACVGFFLMGVVLSSIRAQRGFLGRFIDLCTLLLGLFFLSFVGSLLLEPDGNIGRSLRLQLAPQSFLCMGLIIFLIFNRRVEYGMFSILVDGGIGGKTARVAVPLGIVLPFLIEWIKGKVIRYQLLPVNYALAIVPSLMAMVTFCVILVLARRSGELEQATRELSMRDELTGLYNRRGFFAFAEKSLRQAVRSKEAFSILFLDVDHLKRVNDELGHDVGSELLEDVARLLRTTFREVDVVGRIGGDEFVVAARADGVRMATAVARLDAAADEENRAGKPYRVSLSMGCVAMDTRGETLEEMIDRADELMYVAKRDKRR